MSFFSDAVRNLFEVGLITEAELLPSPAPLLYRLKQYPELDRSDPKWADQCVAVKAICSAVGTHISELRAIAQSCGIDGSADGVSGQLVSDFVAKMRAERAKTHGLGLELRKLDQLLTEKFDLPDTHAELALALHYVGAVEMKRIEVREEADRRREARDRRQRKDGGGPTGDPNVDQVIEDAQEVARRFGERSREAWEVLREETGSMARTVASAAAKTFGRLSERLEELSAENRAEEDEDPDTGKDKGRKPNGS